MKTPRYFAHMTGPSGWPFNYSDCDPKPLLNPAMFWFASRLKEPGLLLFESKLIEQHKNLHRIRELPALMVWSIDLNLTNIPKPKDLQWVGGGKNPVALLRSSWDPAKAIFAGLKGGSPQVAHGHMDIGSFVVDALGERWAIDLGHQDYNSLESKGLKIFHMKQQSDRWKVYRMSNFSHNTLTIDKQLQNVEGYAPIISSTSVPKFRSAVTDLTAVYSINTKKALRGVAIVEDQYVVIRDEITLKYDGTVRWNMITGADVKIIDNRTAELTKNGKKLYLRVSEPADAVLTTWSTAPPNTYDEANPGTVSLGFETRIKSGSEKIFTVLMIPGTSTTKSKMTIPSLKEWSSVN
jgi:Heparinase II/III-like protein